MSESGASLPRLYEEGTLKGESRKGYVLLVPWMLIGVLWLRLNSGLDQSEVDFYFGLLVAGSMSLWFLDRADPRVYRDLAKLKLLPFVLFFGLLLLGVFVAFAGLTLLSTGKLTIYRSEPVLFGNFLAGTALIVAPIETLVFQYIVPKISTMSLKNADSTRRRDQVSLGIFGGVLSQGTFAGFHYAVSGHSLGSMAVIFLLGMGFYSLVRMSPVWGLGAAMGAHSGWNIAIAVFTAAGAGQVLGGMI